MEFTAADGTYFRLPDVAYWAPDRPIEEIRSPGQTMASLRDRSAFFLANGVEVAWVLDPQSRTVEVFDAYAEGPAVLRPGDTLTAPQLPRFALPVADLFAVLDR